MESFTCRYFDDSTIRESAQIQTQSNKKQENSPGNRAIQMGLEPKALAPEVSTLRFRHMAEDFLLSLNWTLKVLNLEDQQLRQRCHLTR